MNILHTILILATAFVLVFLQATVTPWRNLLGAQIDFLPSLMIYTGLSSGITSISLVAICGGIWLDSLSANPLGISVLPLFIIGFIIQRYRGLILRDQSFAQFMLGLGASALAPLITLGLLLNMNEHPLLGWFSIWQWVVMAVGGAVATPIWFWIFDRLLLALSYQPLNENSFRPDRQIKRGRS
jgi:rod shape-determining protein MreD